jgi:hypothetical protein
MNRSFRAIVVLTLFSLVSYFLTTPATAATPPSYFNDCGYPEYKPQSLTEFCADAGNGVTKAGREGVPANAAGEAALANEGGMVEAMDAATMAEGRPPGVSKGKATGA